MKIYSVSGFMPYWGTDMAPGILEQETGKTVGGGEEAAIRTAAELVEHGHDVTLWWCGKPGKWRGVEFKSNADPLSSALLRDPPDVALCWSTILPFQFVPKTTLRLLGLQLNDCWCQGDWSTVDCVVSPSRKHAEQLDSWGWKKRPWTVVHNGLDPELYGGGGVEGSIPRWVQTPERGFVQVPPWKSRPLDVGYWSSPDRGLHHLLKAWPEVVRRVPNARLHVFYEIDRWLGTGAARSLGPFGDRARLMLHELLPQAKADSSVTFHGAVTRRTLAKTQLQCRVMCYPFQPVQFVEGFAGAVNQGVAAGCHVLLTPHDAMESLYDGAVTWLERDVQKMEAQLPDMIVRALTDEVWSRVQVKKAEPHRFKYTWERAGDEMERAVHRDWDWVKEGSGET